MTLEESDSKLLDEWDYEKNDLSPSDISASSHQKIWWKCSSGHSWSATVANRYKKNQGCPYCSRRLPVIGIDDLFSTNPELKNSWDFRKNKSLNPELLKAGSEKRHGGYAIKGIRGKLRFFTEQFEGMVALIVRDKKY